jgi:hypothetical protein
MATFTGPPASAIRNQPIATELRTVLERAANDAGVDSVHITSGGQPALGEGTRRTGSTRHDRGRAADLQLVVGGRTLTFTDNRADPIIAAFVTASAAHGATGIGAGVGYMGNRTIHVGFGTSVRDRRELTWGAGGRSATAPQWLRDAAQAGWTAPAADAGAVAARSPGRYVIIARNGLKLRLGPGTEFQSERTLPLGTELDVTGFDGPNRGWARVDLESDGLLDGHVFAAFLAAAGAANPSHEDVAEPEGMDA